MTVFDKLKGRFDHIVVLTLSNRPDRQQSIMQQLKYIGMVDVSDVEFWYATPFPYNGLICEAFNAKYGKQMFDFPNEFDCARNHYGIVRKAFDLDYKNVLIMEDDIAFLKDSDKFISYIDAIPDDFDILQFDAYNSKQEPQIMELLQNNSDKWYKHDKIKMWNADCYALSRKGMEYYLAYMDICFSKADQPLYFAPINLKCKINTYCCNPLLAVQKRISLGSNIRTDKENYLENFCNCLEFNIDKENDYFN